MKLDRLFIINTHRALQKSPRLHLERFVTSIAPEKARSGLALHIKELFHRIKNKRVKYSNTLNVVINND